VEEFGQLAEVLSRGGDVAAVLHSVSYLARQGYSKYSIDGRSRLAGRAAVIFSMFTGAYSCWPGGLRLVHAFLVNSRLHGHIALR